MKVVNLPPSYIEEQIGNSVVRFLSTNMNDYKEKVVLLPRTLSVLAKSLLYNHGMNEITFGGSPKLDAFLNQNLLID